MSVSVDDVVSVMLIHGGPVIVRQKTRLAFYLGVPRHVTENSLMALETRELFTGILRSWVVRKGEEANIGKLRTIMLNMGILAVAERLSLLGNRTTRITLSRTQPQASTSTHVRNYANNFSFRVKPPIQEFVGRTTELKELNDFFIQQTQKCVLINAIGGQGKTELCKKFIQDLITATSSPPVVTWLPGESIQEFTSKVSKLAHRLSISTEDNAGKQLPLMSLLKNAANEIKKQFPTMRWLVVVDNVDDEYPELENIIQVLIKFEALVLITSRKNDIFPGTATPLKLKTLASSDAMLLVRNSLENTSNEDVTLLCDMVGNHALALQQSVAYIKMQMQIGTRGKAYGISNFLQEFQDCPKVILQHPMRLGYYNLTIHAIVRTTLDSISKRYGKVGQVALELATILGLVDPNGVHLDTLHKLNYIYMENKPKSAQLNVSSWLRRLFFTEGPSMTTKDTREAVLLLEKFSMLDVNDEIVSIHRLVQMVLRLDYDYKQAINILLKHIHPKDASIEELRQLISIWEHADHETVKIHPNFAYQIFKRMEDLSPVVELSGFAEKNHTLLSQLLGPNHEETLSMEYCASLAMYQKGDYDVALTMLWTLQDKMKRILGEEHPSTLDTADLISIVLWRLDRNEEALEWGEKVLESRIKVHGENHMATMNCRSNKALILVNLCRMDEALSILQHVLEWREVKLGSSHPHTLDTRNTIDLIPFREKLFYQAKSQCETLLKLSVEVLGEGHVHTLNIKSCLADTYWNFNRREDAITMMEDVLVSLEKVLGPNHPDTNITRNMLSTWKKSKTSP